MNPKWKTRERSAAEILIEAHYKTVKADEPMPWEEYEKVCAYMSLTPFELAALVLVTPAMVRRFKRGGAMPAHVALHFRIMHGWYRQQRTGIQTVPLIPVGLAFPQGV